MRGKDIPMILLVISRSLDDISQRSKSLSKSLTHWQIPWYVKSSVRGSAETLIDEEDVLSLRYGRSSRSVEGSVKMPIDGKEDAI